MKMSRSILKRKEDESCSEEDMPGRKMRKVELKLDMDPKIMDSMLKDIFKAVLKRTNNHAMAINIVNTTQNLRYAKLREISLGLIIEEKTEEDLLHEYESSTDEADYSSSEDDSGIDENKMDSYLKLKEIIKLFKK